MANIIDIVLIAILVFAIVRGLITGFVKQIGGIVGLILGYMGSRLFSGNTESFLRRVTDLPESIYTPLGILITFLGCYAACMLVATLLQKLLEGIALGGVNRLVGALFCTIKYAIVLSVVLNILIMLNIDGKLFSKQLRAQSLLYNQVVAIAPTLFVLSDIEIPNIEIPDFEMPKGGNDTEQTKPNEQFIVL